MKTIDEDVEQYKIVTSPQFRSWFGDSKIVDDSGDPLVCYHGSTHDIGGEFKTKGHGNKNGHHGEGSYFTTSSKDAGDNYAGIGPDLAVKIEARADMLQTQVEDEWDEWVDKINKYSNVQYDYDSWQDLKWDAQYEILKQIATDECKGDNDGNITPVFLSVKNPVVIGLSGMGVYSHMKSTYFDYDYEYDEDTDEESESGEGVRLMDALHDNLPEHADEGIMNDIREYMQGDSGISVDKVEEIVRMYGLLDDYDDGDTTGSTLHSVYRDLGFDGIVLNAAKAHKSMRLNGDTLHIIPFSPNQVKSAYSTKFGTGNNISESILSRANDLI